MMGRRPLLLLLTILLLLPLCGCGEALTGTREGRYFECDRRGDTVRKVTVRESEGGKTLFTAAIDSDFPTDSLDEALTFADLNFDGEADLLIRTSGAEERARYDVFLWHPSRRTYVKNSLLCSWYEPTADPATGEVTGHVETIEHEERVDDGGERYTVYTYERTTVRARYDGASLIPFYTEGVRYYSESDIYCYVVSEAGEYGELEEVREIWLRPDKFANSPYASLMPSLPE